MIVWFRITSATSGLEEDLILYIDLVAFPEGVRKTGVLKRSDPHVISLQ
jgi:hypothetical protein